ncbi:MAG TPA: NBR1-Ig-like domain-containing protein, partial [Anaerolineales bacterium]|nr:NBR1-Ig-like domain-containing protein [Anaerolineales bacterium]
PAVNPGQEVELDVDLKAPNTPGNHRSYWRIVTNANVLVPVANGYQGRAFFADIKVQAPPTATNTTVSSTTVTITSIPGESGQVRSDGLVLAAPNTGDIESNAAAQAFFSFNISSIPAGKTITKVVVDFGSGHDTLGNPWGLGDGCVRAYVQNYGTLDATDFFVGDPTGAITRWCGSAQLNSVFEDDDMKSALQAALGSSRFQLRVQFRQPTVSNNGIADMIRFGTVKLIVTYQ